MPLDDDNDDDEALDALDAASTSARRALTAHRRSLSSPADAFASFALADSLLTTTHAARADDDDHNRCDDESGAKDDGIDWDRAPMDVKELATRDPKRARRILANRLSAARSKARKVARASALARALEALTREEEALERERERLTTAVATLGVENSALQMMIYSDVDRGGEGGEGEGEGE